MIPSLEALRGVRRLVRTLSPSSKAAADQPLLREWPSLRASCHWDVITDAGLYDVYASFTKSDGGAIVLASQVPVVIQCFLESHIDVISVRSPSLGLCGVFPSWTWRKMFLSTDYHILKVLLTMRPSAERRFLNKILNSPDVVFEYYGCNEESGVVFIGQRTSVAEAVLADGRVSFDFSKDIVGFGRNSKGGDDVQVN